LNYFISYYDWKYCFVQYIYILFIIPDYDSLSFKPLTNKQKICSLIEELAQGQSRYNELVKENEELISILSKIDKRIQYKRDEFAKKVQELDKELADKLLCGERIEWADEALTVYANMLELLDKIVE